MINGISPPGTPATPPIKSGAVTRGAPVGDAKAVLRDEAAAPSPAADLAAAGPPVDSAKVAAIRAGIADGSYKVDPEAIAAAMIALDLPPAP
jgi:negative regulator of flagellin synthesis FlgM